MASRRNYCKTSCMSPFCCIISKAPSLLHARSDVVGLRHHKSWSGQSVLLRTVVRHKTMREEQRPCICLLPRKIERESRIDPGWLEEYIPTSCQRTSQGWCSCSRTDRVVRSGLFVKVRWSQRLCWAIFYNSQAVGHPADTALEFCTFFSKLSISCSICTKATLITCTRSRFPFLKWCLFGSDFL